MSSTTDRVAIVTGAGGAIGPVLARTLLSADFRVVLSAVAREQMDEVVRPFSRDRALVVVGDIATRNGRQELVDAALRAFGQVDILINNAAITSANLWPDYQSNPPKQWEIDEALFARLFAVNTLAPHYLASAVIPGMLQRGWGRIVNITCNIATMHNRIPYGSTKAALESYSVGLAANLAGTGVTVNVLLPGGLIATAQNAGQGLNTVPAEVMAQPIAWLCSDESGISNGRRYNAVGWDESLPPDKIVETLGSPVGWAHLK